MARAWRLRALISGSPVGAAMLSQLACLGVWTPLQAAGDAPGGGGLKTLVQDGGCVRVEIVADQGDARHQAEVYVHQVLQDLGASSFGRRAVTSPGRQPQKAP